MSSAEIVRNMKIKTSTLKRIHKEYVYYQKETEKEQTRVESMKAAGADPHDLRQAVRGRRCRLGHPSSSSAAQTAACTSYTLVSDSQQIHSFTSLFELLCVARRLGLQLGFSRTVALQLPVTPFLLSCVARSCLHGLPLQQYLP
jgi:hypothetical protein